MRKDVVHTLKELRAVIGQGSRRPLAQALGILFSAAFFVLLTYAVLHLTLWTELGQRFAQEVLSR